jgi:predicted 2-oxoglutarate/Fe(II)-dependent dioxygenase YbiX
LLSCRPSPVHHILTIALSEELANEESFGGKKQAKHINRVIAIPLRFSAAAPSRSDTITFAHYPENSVYDLHFRCLQKSFYILDSNMIKS